MISTNNHNHRSNNPMFNQKRRVRMERNWRNIPSPKNVDPAEWDHFLIVDAETAEYLFWKYRYTQCTLHGMKILPSGAQVFLTRRNNIRNEDRKHIETLANDMRLGRFPFVADSIRFDTDLLMLDSHHRCDAGVLAIRPFDANITFGLPPETREVIDTSQKKRCAGSIFRAMGVPNYSAAQTICRDVISCIQTNSFERDIQRVSEVELAAFYEANQNTVDSAVSLALSLNGIFKVSEVGAVLFFLIKSRKKLWTERLVKMVASGRIESDHTPAMTAFAHRAWQHRLKGQDALSVNVIRQTLLAVCNIEITGLKINSRKPVNVDAIAYLGQTLDEKWPNEIVSRV
jgi:hypothetical protein